ncbi:ATP synthase subunit I [Thalassoglobus polymorphus]|uniref:N-ATPase, AtpR subunit n=1 Tax=Thalassoglobus polymorphus TaxID=2527994 RepID=A0A517QKA8_9PLAN|nr:ATP synthase subunit I [Thalassoglobus polymorphus]QDT31977.1 N-ATPase, AtpR subunit [Thalassoglobus polymorphus]
MQSSILELMLSLLAGGLLGLLFYGSLWLTIRQLPRTKQPALLFLGSFLVRMSITLFGFWIVMAGQWERALACLFGFVISRILMTLWLQPRSQHAPAEVIK